MQQVIDGRELITLDGSGVLLRGTVHWPEGRSGSCLEGFSRNRTGIVFLNSLSLPRTATGDSAVYWAEAFAGRGYPSFRFDLPGLGDTPGNIPAELLNFINAGGYAATAAAKVKELVQRFELAGVVLVGHCAGTVTAIHAAAGAFEECKGLILLDPYFHLPQAIRPMVRRGLSEWALRSSLGGTLSKIYDRIRKAKLLLRPNTPPRNANSALLSRWKQVASKGLPILLLKAPARKAAGIAPRVGEFDYIKHVLHLAGAKSQVAVELIEGTDHSFANCAGRAAVRRSIEQWLERHVPLRQEVPVTLLQPATPGPNDYTTYHLNCLHS